MYIDRSIISFICSFVFIIFIGSILLYDEKPDIMDIRAQLMFYCFYIALLVGIIGAIVGGIIGLLYTCIYF